MASASTGGGKPASSAPSNAETDKAPQDIKLMPIKARKMALPRLTICKRSGTVTNIETPYPVNDSIITPIPTATRMTARGGAKLSDWIA